jgi:hypothetical protein
MLKAPPLAVIKLLAPTMLLPPFEAMFWSNASLGDVWKFPFAVLRARMPFLLPAFLD